MTRIRRCVCGRKVTCHAFTNTCECGRDYNHAGQELAPRSQWGEETGETHSEILNSLSHHNSEGVVRVSTGPTSEQVNMGDHLVLVLDLLSDRLDPERQMLYKTAIAKIVRSALGDLVGKEHLLMQESAETLRVLLAVWDMGPTQDI
jgi:hypothetical protein